MPPSEQDVILPAIKLVITAMSNMEQRLAAVENLSRDLQQTVNMIARGPVGRKRPVRCVFLVHNVEAWDAFAEIYAAMEAADDFEPVVATVHRWLAGPPDLYKDEHINHEELQRLRVPHIRLNMANSYEGLDILKAMKPDLLFRQAPWEVTLPPAFAAPELTFARLCYVPYAFMMIRRYKTTEAATAECSSLQTDQILHRLSWRIFCETEMHKNMFRHTAVRGDQNVVCTGYPKFDRLVRAKEREPFWPIPAPDGRRRFRLIWAPHHSVKAAWLNFATFPEIHRDMLTWARTSSDIDFVMKPHPSLFEKLTDTGTMTSQALADYLRDWKELPNATIVEGADYGPLFHGSDAMLTDGVSFLSEYQLFEKPLVFLDSGCHVGFNEAGLVAIEAANIVKSFTEARTLLEKFCGGQPDPKASIRPSVVARLRPYPGQGAAKILEAIRDGLTSEVGESAEL